MLSKFINAVTKTYLEIFYAGYIPPRNNDDCRGFESVVIGDAPRYPPIDQGINLITPQGVLDSQRQLIERIQKTSGMPPFDFEERFRPVIVNLAKYVHLLPATRTGHHRGAGGLFRLALEMGLYSLQIANSTIFVSKGAVSAETRFKQHPRWVYATFVAGICAELYRPVANMVVTDDSGESWSQFLTGLYDWAEKRKCQRYHIVWNVQDEIDVLARSQSTSAYILNSIVPLIGMQYINDGNNEIVTNMTTCVTNSVPNGVCNQLHNIVVDVRKKVIERDLKSNSERYGDFTVGSHLEPHLVDAMRRLIKRKTWEMNTKGARIWYSTEGMFIVWQPAAREILSILKEDNQPGIPVDADTLADILINCGIAEFGNDESRYWDICIPVSMQILKAIKLQRSELLFNDLPNLAKLDGYLLAENLDAVESNAVPITIVQADSSIKNTSAPAVKAHSPNVTDAPSPDSHGNSANKPVVDANVFVGTTDVPKKVMVPMQVASIKVPLSQTKIAKEKEAAADAAKSLFNSLPAEVAEYLRAIVEDHCDGSSTGPIVSTPEGVAVSIQELQSHGLSNFMGLVKALNDKGWLYTDPDKPLKKLLEISHKNSIIQVIVIRKDIAKSMGFAWKQPVKVK